VLALGTALVLQSQVAQQQLQQLLLFQLLQKQARQLAQMQQQMQQHGAMLQEQQVLLHAPAHAPSLSLTRPLTLARSPTHSPSPVRHPAQQQQQRALAHLGAVHAGEQQLLRPAGRLRAHAAPGCEDVQRDAYCRSYCLRHGPLPATLEAWRSWPATAGNCRYVTQCGVRPTVPPELRKAGALSQRHDLSELAQCWLWYSTKHWVRNVSFAWQQQTRPPAASAPSQHTALHGGGGGAGETHQGPRALFRLGSGKMELDNKAHLLRALQMYEARHQCKANQVYPATIELSSKAKCLQAHVLKSLCPSTFTVSRHYRERF